MENETNLVKGQSIRVWDKRASGSDVQAHLSAEVDKFKTFIKIKTGSIIKKSALYSIGKF